MKAKHLLALTVLLAAAIGAVYYFKTIRSGQIVETGGSTSKTKIFSELPINEVTHIQIEGPEDTLDLEKKDKKWTVRQRNNYPADFQKVGELLSNVWDLSVIQEVTVGPSKFGRVGLLSPGADEGDAEEKATVVRFEGGEEKKFASLWLGKEYKKETQSQFGMMDTTAGRYIKRGDAENVYLVDEAFSDAEPEPADWLDDTFFKTTSKVKTIERIPSDDKSQGWKLTRETEEDDFKLADAKKGEEVAKDKVSSMKSAFSNPSFEDVLVDAEQPEHVTFKVETFGGFNYVVKAGEKSDDNELPLTVQVSAELPEMPEAPEGETEEQKKEREETFQEELKEKKEKLEREQALEGHVYLVRGFVIDSLNKKRSEILMEEEEAEETEPESGIPGVDSSLPGIGNKPPAPAPKPEPKREMPAEEKKEEAKPAEKPAPAEKKDDKETKPQPDEKKPEPKKAEPEKKPEAKEEPKAGEKPEAEPTEDKKPKAEDKPEPKPDEKPAPKEDKAESDGSN